MDEDSSEMDPLENDEVGEEEEEEDLEQNEAIDESNEASDANDMMNESETNDELMEEASENEQTVQDDDSPFKKPSDSVSVDGSTSAKESRERHMSVNSVDSDTRNSETDSERRQSANDELAAQYALQLAFYR